MFTDIEGSSRLWDTYRSGMAEALTQHNEIVRSAIAGRGGHVVKDKLLIAWMDCAWHQELRPSVDGMSV